MGPVKPPQVGLLFNHDWDAEAFGRLGHLAHFDSAGFDLLSFPSNAALVGFDLQRFADRQARRGRRRGWAAVLSHHEQFGALAAALVAEHLGLPGATPESILAAQHKLHARRVLQAVAPEANIDFLALDVPYGQDMPEGLHYPTYVKPVKAAFSVLARQVDSRDELQAHTRFGRRELWVIRRLVEPFERVARQRLPGAGSAHRLMLETPLPASTPQYNLDGWVQDGCFHASTLPAMPGPQACRALQQAFPDALFYPMPKSGHSLDRDFKWLGSHRYGILHLGGRDAADLRQRTLQASALLGWPAPYADAQPLALPGRTPNNGELIKVLSPGVFR